MVLLRCPAQFCEFRSEKFNSSLSRTVKGIECRPYCFFFFFLSVLVAFLFFRVVVSVISLGKKTTNKRGPKLNASISTSTTPCPKMKSKLVKLMSAWPIRRSNPFMAGQARSNLWAASCDRCCGHVGFAIFVSILQSSEPSAKRGWAVRFFGRKGGLRLSAMDHRRCTRIRVQRHTWLWADTLL